MIRRSASRYGQNQEALQQNSFTALKGIDCSKAPTENATVLDAVNLDVDYDGGLVLRKPLILHKKYMGGTHLRKYMYDRDTTLCVHFGYGIVSPNFNRCKFTDIYGNTYTTPPVGLQYDTTIFDWNNANVTNTSTTTLLTNIVTNLDLLEKALVERNEQTITLYNKNVEPSIQLRMFKAYKDEDGSWILEMLTPEPTIITGDAIAADFNTVNANPLAIRDNYFATQTYTRGILAYVHSNPEEFASSSIEVSDTITSIGNDFREHTFSADKSFYANTMVTVFVSRINSNELKIIFKADSYNVFTSLKYRISVSQFETVKTTDEYSVNIGANGIIVDEFGGQSRFHTFSSVDLSENFKYSVSIQYDYKLDDAITHLDVSKLTESTLTRLITKVPTDRVKNTVVLKAFLDRPHIPNNTTSVNNGEGVVIKWESSDDGVTWHNVYDDYAEDDSRLLDGESFLELKYVADELSEDLTAESSLVWKTERYRILDLPDYRDVDVTHDIKTSEGVDFTVLKYPVSRRSDCLCIHVSNNYPKTYRCTISKVKYVEFTEGDETQSKLAVDYIISQNTYTILTGGAYESNYSYKNPLSSNMLYWKHRLYAYGNDLNSNIYVSDVDSSIFPMSNIIDLGTYQKGTVRKLIPWRDYLIAFTDNSVHLIQEQEIGFTTKVINTFVGVSKLDADTCVSVMNGIIFKSGDKIYTLSPSYNSGIDTILNISEVSKPVQHILEKYQGDVHSPNFAFTTSENYYLCIKHMSQTICLKYNYTTKVWTHFILPRRIDYCEVLDVDTVKFFDDGTVGYNEYYFEKDINFPEYIYGDVLSYDKPLSGTLIEEYTESDTPVLTPINFSLDSGQKTDNISLTKQFVESKMIVATLNSKDNFKMDVRVDIDGNTFKKHIDLNTDGALLRGSADDVLTLGSNTDFDEKVDTFNTLRQMFLRYAGKGKTIRHIISGESLYKFKIYETFYRYKILNVKQ